MLCFAVLAVHGMATFSGITNGFGDNGNAVMDPMNSEGVRGVMDMYVSRFWWAMDWIWYQHGHVTGIANASMLG